MQTYYHSLQAIHQQTLQLQLEQCRHCRQTHQLVSHGFVRKKRVGGEHQALGKRVWCSNRHRRTGCGRTMQLYLDSSLRYLHYAGSVVVAFALLLLAGLGIAQAYMQATGAHTPRHAWRWLHRLHAQTSAWRSLLHRPLWAPPAAGAGRAHPLRRELLVSSLAALLMQFGQPLCQRYQSGLQRPFF